MTKKQLIKELKKLKYGGEQEHMDADELLLKYIADNEVRKIYEKIDKWYA